MAVTYYDSIGGRILGENTGGVQTDYVPDALGSVVATRDGNGNLLNTYTYKPYGDVLTKTGASPDPAFLFCGSWGYLFLNRAGASHSVRYRVYDSKTGIWTTVDPLWPSETAYVYLHGRVINLVDASGLSGLISWDPNTCVKVPFPSIPFIFLGIPLRLTLFIQACLQKYDNQCCSGPSSTQCSKAIIGGSITTPSLSWSISSNGDIRFVANLLASLAGGIFNYGVLGTRPKKDCKKPHTEYFGKFCIKACASFISVEYCCQDSSSSGLSCDNHITFKYGYCGFPQVSGELTFGQEDCR